MDSPDDAELAAARSSFCDMAARWRLGRADVRDLLGIESEWHGCRVIPDVLDSREETRLRLLLRLDYGLTATVGDADDLADWLREAPPEYGGMTPLQVFRDIALLRAITGALEGRAARWITGS